MVENENKARELSQNGGFQYRQEYHWSEPSLDGHLETLEMLRSAKESGMKRATVMTEEGPITFPIDEMIGIVETLIQSKAGNLPLDG